MTATKNPVGKVRTISISSLPAEYPHKDAVPALAQDDKQRLFDSIAEHGVLEPIVIYGTKGHVLDGHHRIAAASAAGLKEIPTRWIGDIDEAKARLLALKFNVERRQLNEYEKYDLNDLIVAQEQGRTKRAKAAGTPIGRESERIAQRIGSSKDSVKRAKKVKEQGTLEQIEQVRTGKKSLKKAAAEIDEARGQKKKEQKDRQASLPAADDPDKFGVIYIDLRYESWISTATIVEPSEIRDQSLETLPCSPADLATKFASPRAHVLAVRVQPRDLPWAGPAISAAFNDIDLPGAKAPTGVGVGIQVIQIGGDRSDSDSDGYAAPHSYLLLAYVTTDIHSHKLIDTPAAPAPLAIQPQNIYREISALHPGRALAVLDRQPDPADVQHMPADWEFVTDRDLADAVLPSRAATADDDADDDPEWRKFEAEDAVAPPPPKKKKPGKKQKQKKQKEQDAAPYAPATAATADLADEIASLANHAYIHAARAAARQKEGASHLWLVADSDPDTKRPELARARTKITATGRKPARVRAWHVIELPHAKYPASLYKNLASVDPDEPGARDMIEHTLPTKQAARVAGDLRVVQAAVEAAMSEPALWK